MSRRAAIFALGTPADRQEAPPILQYNQMALLLLEGCRDRRAAGLGLFPEILRAEYREIRSVLEAHFAHATLAGHAGADACGYALERGKAGTPACAWVRNRVWPTTHWTAGIEP